VKLKKLGVIALCVFLLTLAFSGVCNAAPEDVQSVYDVDYGGLRLTIIAPVEAYPGENITVTVKTSASDVQQIYINYINMNLYGVVNGTTKITLDQIVHLKDISISSYEMQYNVTIPDNISPGLTYGEISCDWKALSASFELPCSGFILTYVKNVALEYLQAEYAELTATHQSIVQNYTELETDFQEEVGSTRNLAYVFIATTAVAIITVIVLLMRKPKRVWV